MIIRLEIIRWREWNVIGINERKFQLNVLVQTCVFQVTRVPCVIKFDSRIGTQFFELRSPSYILHTPFSCEKLKVAQKDLERYQIQSILTLHSLKQTLFSVCILSLLLLRVLLKFMNINFSLFFQSNWLNHSLI